MENTEIYLEQKQLKNMPILRFHTYSVPAANFDFVDATARANFQVGLSEVISQPVVNIVDKNSHSCGILYGVELNQIVHFNQNTMEFILLSKLEDSTSIKYYGPMRGFDPQCFNQAPWCTLNVMLVESHGDYLKRVAIGRIHSTAWESCKPSHKLIHLA